MTREVQEAPKQVQKLEGAGPSSADYTLTDFRNARSFHRGVAGSADAYLPVMEAPNDLRPLTKEEQVAKDVDNAARQYGKLFDRVKPGADPKEGLTAKDLEALSKQNLNPQEKAALAFLQKNFDALNTKWAGGNYNPARESAVTLTSLLDYGSRAEATGKTEISRDGRRAEAANPQNRPVANDNYDPRRADWGDRPNPGNIKVKDGWGWNDVALESLKKQGIPYSYEVMNQERERLQRLNPDKAKMLHPKHDIVM